MKVAIFGAGSIGCYVGGQLAASGLDVMFIGRARFQRALEEHGLTLTHYERGPLVLNPTEINFYTEARHMSDADAIIVTVKSQDTAEAGRSLAWHAKKEALIISLQNGVSNANVLRDLLPEHTVLAAMVPFNVTGTSPGVFHSGTEGELLFEATSDPRLSDLIAGFRNVGQDAQAHPNMAGVLWGKLLINLNNALNVLHGDNLLTGLAQRDYRKALALSIEEGLRVLDNAGIEPEQIGAAPPKTIIQSLRLPNILYKPMMKKLIKIDAAARSSMLDDLEMGREPEIDYIQGEIVRLAENNGADAPVNRAIYEAVMAAFKNGQSPKFSGKQILGLVKT